MTATKPPPVVPAHPGRPHSWDACYGRKTLPCPGCGTAVEQLRLICTTDTTPPAECATCSVACRSCQARVTVKNRRITVHHHPACGWLARYRATEVAGPVPCGWTVMQRGETLPVLHDGHRLGHASTPEAALGVARRYLGDAAEDLTPVLDGGDDPAWNLTPPG